MDTSKYIELAELLAKEFSNRLSHKEKELLLDYQKNEEMKDVIDQIKSDIFRAEDMQRYSKFNATKAKEKLQWRIAFAKEQRTNKWKQILQYAAMLMLPIVMLGYMTYEYIKIENLQNSKLAKVAIVTGTTQAKLLLSNGDAINLVKANTDLVVEKDSAVIEKNSEGLSYANTKVAKVVQHTVVTPKGGEYKLVLSDGTKVQLNAESEIKYPVNFVGKTRSVSIKGEVFFEVAKNRAKPFIVAVNNMKIKVLGTKFNVMAYGDEPTIQTTLVEGSVAVNINGETNAVVLKPKQQAMLNKATQKIEKHNVDIAPFIAWTKGKFVFENENLAEIMKNLQRWYNVKVFFENQQLKNKKFNVRVSRYNNINDFLKKLEQTKTVKFKINNNVILVQEK